MATAYALTVWAEICENNNRKNDSIRFHNKAKEVNKAANEHLWDGDSYARGITDNNIPFGIKDDDEGRIFLNPQGWALLSGAADTNKADHLIKIIEEELETPFGVQMLAPAYTKMREDVGRVTQKYPGSAENGSIYNHAAAFYIFGLYKSGYRDKAYVLLRKMIAGPDQEDLVQRGQLPVFIPNYYRGAYKQFPKTAGRSSQLFNTGTAPWMYRCLLEGLLGLIGTKKGLKIDPQLPSHWHGIEVVRQFRGATFNITISRKPKIKVMTTLVDGNQLQQPIISNIQKKTYQVEVLLPIDQSKTK